MIWRRDEVAAPLWLRDPVHGGYLWRRSQTSVLQLDPSGTEWIPLQKTRMTTALLSGGIRGAAVADAVDRGAVQESQDHEEEQFKQKYIRTNPFKMYGYREDGEFKIRDVSGYQITKTKRQKTRGRSCKTLDATTVYKYLYMLQPGLPEDEHLMGSPPALSELRDKIRAMPIEEVEIKLKNIRGNKMQKIVEFIEKIKNIEIGEEDKRFILFYTMMNLETLCELLERIFRQKQIYTKTPRKPAPVVKTPKIRKIKSTSTASVTMGQDVVFPTGGGGGGGGVDIDEDDDDDEM
jgi:hypothetical protein